MVNINVPVKRPIIRTLQECILLGGLKNLYFLSACQCCMQPSKDLFKCCWKCAENFGYLKYIIEDQRSMYMKCFDERLGFLGEYGCRLDFKDRSVICITHLCKERKLTLSRPMSEGLSALTVVMKKLENTILMTEEP